MRYRYSMHWLCAAGAALLVAACGGGGSPAPEVSAADRIEPFDPSLGKAAKAAASPLRTAGRAPQATPVRLGPLAAAALQPLQKKAASIPGSGVRRQIGDRKSVV